MHRSPLTNVLGVEMDKPLKILAMTALFALTASVANAAPANVGQVTSGLSNGLVQVEGPHHPYERSCHRGPGGWYRYNRHGERRVCREWRGEGKRPDACVKFGPVWFCDY
jgi:hypothetical protein